MEKEKVIGIGVIGTVGAAIGIGLSKAIPAVADKVKKIKKSKEEARTEEK